MAVVGPSPPDLPKWSYLSQRGHFMRCGGEQAAVPTQYAALPLGELVVCTAEVSPSGRYLAVIVSDPTKARTLVVYETATARFCWGGVPVCPFQQLRGRNFGESFSPAIPGAQVPGGPVDPYTHYLADSGKVVQQRSGFEIEQALTVPREADAAGWIVAIISTRSSRTIAGFAPGAEREDCAAPVWEHTFETGWGPAPGTGFALSARGDCVVHTRYGWLTLHDVRTGECLRQVQLTVASQQPARFSAAASFARSLRLSLPQMHVVDSYRCVGRDHSCQIENGMAMNAGALNSQSCARFAPGGRVLYTQPVDADYMLRLFDRVALYRGEKCIHSWCLEGARAVWLWSLSDCAAFEHTCAWLAIDATDELDYTGDHRGIGLVRAVLAGFIAEDARLTAAQN